MSFISGSGGGYAVSSPGPIPNQPQSQRTPLGGFALQNATPTILTYQVPNDGRQHLVLAVCVVVVTSPETGGQVTVTSTTNGSTGTAQVGAASQGAGVFRGAFTFLADPGTLITMIQASALTGGAATVACEIRDLN